MLLVFLGIGNWNSVIYCCDSYSYSCQSWPENQWNHIVLKMWNTTHISVDENSHFMEFWRVLDASIGVQDINILLFVDNCATHLQDTSFIWYIQFVYYPPNCTGMIPYTKTGYVCMYFGKYVTFKFIYICRHCACHTVVSCVVIMWVAAP